MWNVGDGEAVLYKNMIHCINLAGGKIKGILWYQGCSETGDMKTSGTYLDRFNNFVMTTRNQTSQPDLPFLTVQLNRYTFEQPERHNHWSIVRELQRQAAHKIPGVYVIPALDSPLSDQIHNSATGNILLGNRLADCALTEVYKTRSSYKAPDIKSAVLSTDRQTITLEFDNVRSTLVALYSLPDKIEDFVVEDETGIINYSKVTIERNKIVLGLVKPASTKVRVHGLPGPDPKLSVFDFDPLLPMLAFYNFPVKD
jgi:hypothetical protein